MNRPFTRYLVGGAVRDQLLGLPVTERDWVVVGATPDDLEAAGYRPVGQDFPVFIEPQSGDEYALARTERKSGKGYGGFVFHASPEVTLEEDLIRRDLTVNAMAMTEDGTIIDPYEGQRDLQERVLRHVSPAFAEDPLRVLRVARFAARYAGLGFHIADETLSLMRQLAESGELSALTAERSWKEISRALMEDHPEVFIQTLRDCGALEQLFPELERVLCEQQLKSLRQTAIMKLPLAARWACLLSHIGHALSGAGHDIDHPDYLSAATSTAKQISERCKAPRDCQELAQLTRRYLQAFRHAQGLEIETLMEMFKAFDIYRRPERFEQFLQVGEAEASVVDDQPKENHQAGYLRGAAEVAREVQVQPLIEQGFGGAELGQAMERERRKALSDYAALAHRE